MGFWLVRNVWSSPYRHPSAALGMTKRGNVSSHFFSFRCEPTSAPSGHLLPREGGSVHESPFPWKGLPSAARRGWLPFLRRSRLLFAFPIGEGGTASAVDRVLSQTAYLRRSFPLVFHTASTLSGSLRSPPSPRGEGFVRRYSFSTYACIRSDDMGIAASSYRSLPKV